MFFSYIYWASMILFLASPIVAISIAVYSFSAMAKPNRKVILAMFTVSILASFFLAPMFDSIRGGDSLGFSLLLYPFHYSEAMAVSLSTLLIAYHGWKGSWKVYTHLLAAGIIVVIIYTTNSTIMHYCLRNMPGYR
jgi:hypothetical protein